MAILFQFHDSVTLHPLIKYDYLGKILRSSDCEFKSDFLDNILTDDIARLCRVTNLFSAGHIQTKLSGNISAVPSPS